MRNLIIYNMYINISNKNLIDETIRFLILRHYVQKKILCSFI